MVGALLGDMVGSSYEFKPIKTKEFPLLKEDSTFTDDSVMTLAVAQATMDFIEEYADDDAYNDPKNEIPYKMRLIKTMQSWGMVYPFVGYGNMYRKWLFLENPQSYNSFGNGSGMRVSSIGWLFKDLSNTLTFARWSAEVTHDHEEGIKGAQAIAAAIFLAREGKSKEDIKTYIENTFCYQFRTIDEIRPGYSFDVTCQGSVPEAIECFLESNNTIDAIRNAVSLGGDADTQACMAGAIAEAYYGRFSKDIMMFYEAFEFKLDISMVFIIERFNRHLINAGIYENRRL